MKKGIFSLWVFLIAGTLLVNAQGGPRQTIEERVKNVKEKIATFKLDSVKSAKADSVFTTYFKGLDATREEMRASGSFDRDKMRTSMEKLTSERDTKLKSIFTDEQYKKWKDEIEPSLRPRRPGGGGPR